ncbi:MAG: ABC-F family ATP-binding cassette domain-containing protein [Candidatus Eisenbacteria bacterium]|uniref:ABC-F family ATP-binding cassette domain-containing protein n=1 Tax=Eiseniibacteriota bacterium TaxID=2212470 RepID=A0A538TN58_UNCEI|nr:MAG: ABC-F family ATP-binding cassette domain-containing protein [Candidatus Eisenbacteria bacterium]
MILVRLDRVTHGFGARTLFEDLSFRVGDDARMGLVGRNGTGKTTLLRILAGTVQPERGTRSVSPRVRVAMLDQKIEPDGEETAFEYARGAFRELLELMEREDAVREELLKRGDAPAEELTALAHELGHLHDYFARMGGHSIDNRVEEILEGLGVGRPLWAQPLRTLSGATEWLENFLARSSEPFVLVSHDRTLLDRVCTSVAEIEHGGLEQHAGNYTQFARKKLARMEQEAKRYALDLKERERQEDFIRRNIAGQKTKQAQSRRKRLEREGPLERPRGETDEVATFDRLRASRSGSHVIATRGITMGYGSRVLNGELVPLEGTVEWGAGVKQAGLDQEAQDLSPNASVLDTLWDLRPTTDEVQVRNFLGGFLFRGDEVHRKVGTLSGGERTRLGLARLIWSGPNLIFLDEPTNHLDIASRESLEAALKAYDGTLIVVSHDRYFLDAVATQILWLDAGEARAYRGTFSDAREKRASATKTAPASKTAAAPKSSAHPVPFGSTKEARALQRTERDRVEREQRKRDRAKKSLEAEIAGLERRLAELTAAMEDDSAKGDLAALREASEEYGRARSALDELLARWVETAE